jgi:hypothetical protein
MAGRTVVAVALVARTAESAGCRVESAARRVVDAASAGGGTAGIWGPTVGRRGAWAACRGGAGVVPRHQNHHRRGRGPAAGSCCGTRTIPVRVPGRRRWQRAGANQRGRGWPWRRGGVHCAVQCRELARDRSPHFIKRDVRRRTPRAARHVFDGSPPGEDARARRHGADSRAGIRTEAGVAFPGHARAGAMAS